MKIIIALVFIVVSFTAISQNEHRYQIQWKTPVNEKFGSELVQFLRFDQASYNDKNIPIWSQRIKLSAQNNSIEATLINPTSEAVSDAEAVILNKYGDIPTDFSITVVTQIEKKVKYGTIQITPLKKNASNGKFEKLISFNLDVRQKYIPSISPKTKRGSFTTNSVLRTGKWVKIKIPLSGIYKLTFSDIKNYGLNPVNISVFGNGGGMLPLLNKDFRHDDLVQNSISFEDVNGNGTFDNGDYILFYAEGSTSWRYDTLSHKYLHTKHLYSDYNYYFLTDYIPAKTISTVSSLSSGNVTVNSFDDYDFHETDSLNLIKSGRSWVGEQFDIITNYNFNFNFPNVVTSIPLKISTSLLARSSASSLFNISANGHTLVNSPVSIPSVNLSSTTNAYAYEIPTNYSYSTTSENLTLNINYNKPNSSSQGWLNYIIVNARRNLIMAGNQMQFRDMTSVGLGKIASFVLTGVTSDTRIWDITDPLNVKQIIPISNAGGTIVFNALSDSLRQYVAFSGSSFYTPIRVGDVTNQNLHDVSNTDLVIVTHPIFQSYAEQLANHHRNKDNMSVVVVKPDEIYNEFSSGCPDVSAIRDFMRMLYEKASSESEMPKNLLLFGSGSYDNKTISATNTNFILTYESANSLDPTGSYVSDDFFTLLDSTEGNVNGTEKMDIGVGRLPVKTVDEAKLMIDKIINYTSPNAFGDWRNVITFVADDAEDVTQHQTQANDLANRIDTSSTVYNIDKIYLDAYQQISTPSGNRYPDVNLAITNRIKKGTLIFNYTGHGNELGLAHERVITTSDIASWNNWNKLPVFMTATCEFSRFDDYSRTPAGALILLNPKGGAIALFSTTRLVYSTPNYYLNLSFYDFIFKKDANNQVLRLGEVMRLTKNDPRNDGTNKRNFTLLGDPALQISIPKNNIVTTSINSHVISSVVDTIKALSKVTVSGYVADPSGTKLTGFNGIIYPTVFDKPKSESTRGNDGNSPLIYKTQNKTLFKGKASVKSGEFTYSFIVPKDISYTVGYGKFSYYADNSVEDAAGYFNKFFVGGTSTSTFNDEIGPTVQLYMNDEHFVFGGLTDESPVMLAIAEDSSGINTVGNGIGHDITAVMDGNTNKTLVLNEYYEAELDNYQKGRINYDFTQLNPGPHNIKLKVWDVNNNSAESYTEFIVANSAELVLDHIFNYPNPFTTQTAFYFDHNLINTDLSVLIQVFTITGKIIKTIEGTINTSGYRSSPLNWDGKDDYGDKIGRGVYIYKIRVKPPTGHTVEKFEKLVILK